LPGNIADRPRIPRASRKIVPAVTAPALPPSPEERYRLLLRIAESVNERLELAAALEAARFCLAPHVPLDAIVVITIDGPRLRRHAISAAKVPRVEGESARSAFARVIESLQGDPSFLDEEMPLEGSAVAHIRRTRETLVYGDIPNDVRFPEDARLAVYGIQSLVRCPLERGGEVIGTIAYAREHGAFSAEETALLEEVSRPMAAAVANSLAYEEIARLKTRLEEENLFLRSELDARDFSGDIVGSSAALRRVLSQVERVARTDSTVLIEGETGTGKELIAAAIHKRSARSLRPMISLNCAALPPGLVASELFGHEKGAFTGAIQRRAGRFELARSGTLFLDEVGDLPPEVQAALLRVLQEGTFERVGGSETLKTDARLIAATNRDLARDVASGRFRSDLFYRLNVFPIAVPPLRDRREDIPILVEYFAALHGAALGRRFRRVDRRTMDALVRYDWPGNVRELENLVERAAILSEGDRLVLDVSALASETVSAPDRRPSSLRDQERHAIEDALRRTRGRVSGRNGAAVLLDLPSTTLESKIRKLKIDKYRFRGCREARPGSA
jgi:formate hydrogenlyase transcriptional activator